MPIFPHSIGGPSRRSNDSKPSHEYGCELKQFYHLLLRHDKLRENAWKAP